MVHERRIDSIAQSWGVISGAADRRRAERAMAAAEQHLIRRGDGLTFLFTPPFDRSALDPGYIKGCVPGVRENGGQYTHAAIWTVIAYALLGDGDRAGELFALLNPVNHTSTRAGLHKHKVEPYVVAADVYAVWPHTGRCGWTWYTGSSGWTNRAGLESILGFQLRGARLKIDPCVPRYWREFELRYRRGATRRHIKVENPQGVCRGIAALEVDGAAQTSDDFLLTDDGAKHTAGRARRTQTSAGREAGGRERARPHAEGLSGVGRVASRRRDGGRVGRVSLRAHAATPNGPARRVAARRFLRGLPGHVPAPVQRVEGGHDGEAEGVVA